jgi:polyisoprenoid-binding protein YceI
MRRALVLAAALCLSAPVVAAANPTTRDPAKAPAGTYVLDPRHASLIARIPHMGFSHFAMRFDRLDGRFTYDPARWQATEVTIRVDPNSVDTGDPAFSKQVAGYFHTDRYPQITFVSDKVTQTEEGRGEMPGDLTLHGVTRPVTLQVVFNGAGPGLLGAGTRMGFSGTAHIKRSDFGMTAVSAFAGDEVDLQFDVEFQKK